MRTPSNVNTYEERLQRRTRATNVNAMMIGNRPITNIEMMAWRAEQQREWNELTADGEHCCGGDCDGMGYCKSYLAFVCPDIIRARELLKRENHDVDVIGPN